MAQRQQRRRRHLERCRNNGSGVPVGAVADLNWKVAGAGDFNGDGKSDILWRNASSGADAIWNGADSGATAWRSAASPTSTGKWPGSATSTATARATSCGATPAAAPMASGMAATAATVWRLARWPTSTGKWPGLATSTATARTTSCGATPAPAQRHLEWRRQQQRTADGRSHRPQLASGGDRRLQRRRQGRRPVAQRQHRLQRHLEWRRQQQRTADGRSHRPQLESAEPAITTATARTTSCGAMPAAVRTPSGIGGDNSSSLPVGEVTDLNWADPRPDQPPGSPQQAIIRFERDSKPTHRFDVKRIVHHPMTRDQAMRLLPVSAQWVWTSAPKKSPAGTACLSCAPNGRILLSSSGATSSNRHPEYYSPNYTSGIAVSHPGHMLRIRKTDFAWTLKAVVNRGTDA